MEKTSFSRMKVQIYFFSLCLLLFFSFPVSLANHAVKMSHKEKSHHLKATYVHPAVLTHHLYIVSPVASTSPTHHSSYKAAAVKNLRKGLLHTHNALTITPHSTSKFNISSWKVSECKPVTIIIDAGHGGKDPGASGELGTVEKNITLAISKQLYADLQNVHGIKPILTRNADYFITLRQRLGIARKYHGDIFISVHADSYLKSSRGASVFVLSEKGASSEAARWLAERENYSELGGLSQFKAQPYLVRSVLLDLSQNSTIASSLQLGGNILNQFRAFTVLHSHKVEQARFVVLKSPDIPSILIETGFVSNPLEERNLANRKYQQILCAAIVKGIIGYLQTHPIEGTILG